MSKRLLRLSSGSNSSQIQFPTEAEIRAVKGGFCNLVVPFLGQGVSKEGGRLLFTPGYVVENEEVRRAIRQTYKLQGWRHFPINCRNGSRIYRDFYTQWDEREINKFLIELWQDGLIPICSILNDNETSFNPYLDSNLVRYCFWWEDPFPIKRPAFDNDNKFWRAKQQYPKAVIAWHNPPGQEAPYIEYSDWGLEEGDPGTNALVYRWCVSSGMSSLLFQGRAWEGVNNSIRGINESLVPRLKDGVSGYPIVDLIDFEEVAFFLFDEDGTQEEGLNLAHQVRSACPRIDGYCNG